MVRSNDNSPMFAGFPPVGTADWEAQIRVELDDASRLMRSIEGIELRAYYRAENLDAPPAVAASRGWLIRQDIDSRDPEAWNAEALEAVAGGVEALGLQVGSEADDLSRLLEGIPLPDVALYLRGDALDDMLSLLEAEIGRRGIDAGSVRGGLESTVHDHELHAELITRADRLPGLRVLDVSAAAYHDAGATAAQELGCIAAAVTDALASGISPIAAARQLQLSVPVGPVYLLEIAKLRALRRVTGQVLAEFGVDGVRVPIIARTSARNESADDPHLNIVRSATEAAAAVLGGADVLTVRPFDSAAPVPGALGRRLARNTQLILRHEARLADVADPAAGSYYIERAAGALAAAGWSFFQEIERRGGLRAATLDGFVPGELDRARSAREKAASQPVGGITFET